MSIIQIDVVYSLALQRRLHCLSHIRKCSAEIIRPALEAKLYGDKYGASFSRFLNHFPSKAFTVCVCFGVDNTTRGHGIVECQRVGCE